MLIHRLIVYIIMFGNLSSLYAMDNQNTQTSEESQVSSPLSTFLASTAASISPSFPIVLLTNVPTERTLSFEESRRIEEMGRIQALIASDIDVNEPLIICGKTVTALTFCAEKNYHQFIKLLVNRGAHRDRTTNNALLIASEAGHIESIKELLACNADIEIANETGETALLMAVKKGHINIARLLLNHGANPNKISFTFGHPTSALEIAICNENAQMVALLLTRWPQSCTTPQLTFSHALKRSNPSIVSQLMDCGVNPFQNRQLETTPLHLAAQNPHTPIAKVLLHKIYHIISKNPFLDVGNKNNNWADNNKAAAKQKLTGTQAADKMKAIINARNKDNQTPLHVANNINTIKLLIKYGADLFARDNTNTTAFDLMFKFLPSSRRDDCQLYFANRSQYSDAELLSLGQCKKIFLIAFFFRDTPVIKKIIHSLETTHRDELKTMLNFHTIDSDGNTMLIDAVQQEDTELIELLVKTGLIKPNRKNKKGFSAFHYALLYNLETFTQHLFQVESYMFNRCLRHYQALHCGRLETPESTLKTIRSCTELTAEQNAKMKAIADEIQLLDTFRAGCSTDWQLTNITAITALLKLSRSISDLKNDTKLATLKSAIRGNSKIVSLLANAGADIDSEILALAAEIDYNLAIGLLLLAKDISNILC